MGDRESMPSSLYQGRGETSDASSAEHIAAIISTPRQRRDALRTSLDQVVDVIRKLRARTEDARMIPIADNAVALSESSLYQIENGRGSEHSKEGATR